LGGDTGHPAIVIFVRPPKAGPSTLTPNATY
jgi:hypothetical protein